MNQKKRGVIGIVCLSLMVTAHAHALRTFTAAHDYIQPEEKTTHITLTLTFDGTKCMDQRFCVSLESQVQNAEKKILCAKIHTTYYTRFTPQTLVDCFTELLEKSSDNQIFLWGHFYQGRKKPFAFKDVFFQSGDFSGAVKIDGTEIECITSLKALRWLGSGVDFLEEKI